MSKDKDNIKPPLKPVALPSMADGLTRYMAEIKRFPVLDSNEEFVLAKRWQEHRDKKAAEALVTSHLRLVAKIANGYRGYGLPIIDLIAEGNVGLIQALGKFDPDKGFRFSTYAMWWIKANIQEYILHSWSLVKIGTTAAQKKLFFNLRRMKGEMQDPGEEIITDKTIKEIANTLNVQEKEVREMSKRMLGPDQSLNAPIKQSGQEEWQDWLIDEDSTHETKIMDRDEQNKKNELLQNSMKSLNEREQKVIIERRLKEPASTLEDLSSELGVSRERVRQIEQKAFQKLQKAIRTTATQSRLLG